MELSAVEKYALFSKVYMANKDMRSLPRKFHKYLAGIMRYEKVVKKGGRYYLLSQMPPYPSKAFDRYMQVLVDESEGRHRPISLEFAITNRCRYNCWHCSNAKRSGKDLPKAEVIRILRGFIDLGVTWVGLSGGEPLLRNDLEDIVACAGDDAAMALFTTGHSLTPERAKSLKDAGLASFVVSLDSQNRTVHDTKRGHEGAYEAALNTIKMSNQLGLYTAVSTVAQHSNVSNKDIEWFLRFCKRRRVDEVRVVALACSGKLISGSDESLTKADVRYLKALHKRANLEPDYPKTMIFPYLESPEVLGCSGGYQHLTVDAQGNVCPCPFLALSLGNAAEEGVEKVWGRYSKTFSRPHSKCINSRVYRQIAKLSADRLPLGVQDSKRIYSAAEPGEMPGFYAALKRK